ncbi:universal stress protein [Arenibacter sp. GZD96]|uniref:universal stress protein n=1 Tax=Aurantibrevibacter litoralis TaxID=3106030 RepID=UPI002AFE5728|nr:universal stress protein [Arenibacter sp. GZD-96]MEA1785204.1 universal stress protein [Arenibacter sp. GZD-96]
MKNIILPTDFSENAMNAARYAIALYKEEACVFHLLNTYTPAISYSRFMAVSGRGHLEDTTHNDSQQKLDEVRLRLSTEYANPKHHFTTVSSFNLLVDEIEKVVEAVNADLIVTGTKGASGLEAVFMGSNTVRIIKSIKNCPVLAVPQYSDFTAPTEIAFATDFNRFFTSSELQPLIDLATSFNATVQIVHVQEANAKLTEMQQFNLAMLRKYLKDITHYVHQETRLNSITKTLELFTTELDIHLLVMLKYAHSFMEKLTREPIIKQAAFQTQIPLLVIPELGMATSTKTKNTKEESTTV